MPGEEDPDDDEELIAADSITVTFWRYIMTGNIKGATELLAMASAQGIQIAGRNGVTAISALLGKIYTSYPASAQQCTTAAQKAAEALRAAGQNPAIITIRDRLGAQIFFLKDGVTRFASTGFHQAVYSGGRVYDALTGPNWNEAERLYYDANGLEHQTDYPRYSKALAARPPKDTPCDLHTRYCDI